MSRFLNELEASRLLSEAGIDMAGCRVAAGVSEAEAIAETIGFPVVMKVLSADIQHKTDAGCVFIGVENKQDVVKTYETIMGNAKKHAPAAHIDGVLIQEMAASGLEIIAGLKRDPQFGPVILVGMGGIYVEVFHDVSMRLIPVSRDDIEEMLKETKVIKLIEGARGKVYDKAALIDALLRLSELAVKRTDIEEIDINPLFLYEEGKGLKGVDALIRIS
ncbi:MAG TPA: acetate--CoA ligase family protein [Anaerovoracaceae bacterium]|nr:acetate--CoA ligase family protein [Anaerovoracaceae bacterium]